MSELHLPWLELAIAVPVIGAALVSTIRNSDRARSCSLIASALTLILSIGSWRDFTSLHIFEAHGHWDAAQRVFHQDMLVIDELSAPLLPLAALLYFLTILATLRTKARRFSFGLTLASEAILLATFSCRLPWVVALLLAIGSIPPLIELRRRGKPTRVYGLHAAAFVGLLLIGQTLVATAPDPVHPPLLGLLLLTGAVLFRSGVVPVHCWLTDLFEHASFGTSLLFVTPMVGAYGAMRLVLPIAPGWALHTIALLSLATAVYAAGMALVQQDARRFFSYLFLSHSSLVLVGLELVTPVGLTGALCVWVSVGLSLTGFGLTLRSVEARTGRLSLGVYHGLYEQTPLLAAFFLLTGLASIGFPGTIGFVGAELLVEGAVDVSPWVGVFVVITAALNGLAVMQAYFRVFTGCIHPATIDLRSRPPERIAALVLTLLILGGGLIPQPGVSSRYHAAVALTRSRDLRRLSSPEDHSHTGAKSGGRRWFVGSRERATAPLSPVD
ncbi:MAG: proton-conducting transporter membrane subunit [Planctomycetaceae bacterium]